MIEENMVTLLRLSLTAQRILDEVNKATVYTLFGDTIESECTYDICNNPSPHRKTVCKQLQCRFKEYQSINSNPLALPKD